jgi:asparagine synthase (glutamine-hydrolysing)
MCGITGLVDPDGRHSDAELGMLAERMAVTLTHRGPDDAGTWVDARTQLALGHRRLAIIDLTSDGHQPMVSADGRWILAFNGEIYNYRDLRVLERAHGYPFRGSSDTEVLLASLARRGLRDTLVAAEGMFALAAYDTHERQLYLARDRFGEKPLFYGAFARTLLFGSELKALRAHPAFVDDIDRDALSTYFRFKYVPAPRSIYRHVRKVPPGSFVTVEVGTGTVSSPVAYYSVRDRVETATTAPFQGDFDEAAVELRELLTASIRDRLVADVPVGAFLSGGLDSSVVVAIANELAGPVQTFTVGFEQRAWDEAAGASALARRLGTDHHELRVAPSDVTDVIPRLPRMYDEPFGDSSQLPTHLVAAFARRTVTVALSGDGGDEVFGGYNRHVWAPRLWQRLAPLPAPVRRMAGRGLGAVGEGTWDRLAARVARVAPRLDHRLPGQKLHKLARALEAPSAAAFYRDLLSHWREPDRLVLDGREFDPVDWPVGERSFAQAAMLLDLVGYLPDDILQKVDRATMAVSLEARVPYLSTNIVEFAWRLPLAYRIQDSVGKRVLRRVLEEVAPGAVHIRPKMGFGVPIGDWLRTDIRRWADDLLTGCTAFDDGILDQQVARVVWSDHLGGSNRQYELWTLLMFLSWYEETTSEGRPRSTGSAAVA